MLDAVKAGATGYLVKSASRAELLAARAPGGGGRHRVHPGTRGAGAGGVPPALRRAGRARPAGHAAADRAGDGGAPAGGEGDVVQADRGAAVPVAPDGAEPCAEHAAASCSCTTGCSWSGTRSSKGWTTSWSADDRPSRPRRRRAARARKPAGEAAHRAGVVPVVAERAAHGLQPVQQPRARGRLRRADGRAHREGAEGPWPAADRVGRRRTPHPEVPPDARGGARPRRRRAGAAHGAAAARPAGAGGAAHTHRTAARLRGPHRGGGRPRAPGRARGSAGAAAGAAARTAGRAVGAPAR